MATNDPNIPEEEILDEEEYPRHPGKQPMVDSDPDEMSEAKKCNEELARLAAEAQAAQAPPPQDTQAPPPQDAQIPPCRPQGRLRKSATTGRAGPPLPPAEQPVPLRPRRGNRDEGPANPTAEAPAGVKCVQVLIEFGANVHVVDYNKDTPLHYAAHYGQKECVAILLENEASITSENMYDKTPIHIARQENHDHVVKLLEGVFL
ncbi:uncharacterized protein LOC133825764 [Humulus lupulus]|uniref:uncharacterized protein LOC133825764 n=1 Tax=Humulus lupulus TaxID=3486 RepID=UPI002B410D7D|nr:uncharacterized protein LOC133825764 [Humulus lupulus]